MTTLVAVLLTLLREEAARLRVRLWERACVVADRVAGHANNAVWWAHGHYGAAVREAA